MSTPASLPGRPGLSNLVDIIIAPSAAFDRLRAVPTWGWALLAASVLGIIGSLLSSAASMHAIDVSMPARLAADPSFAKLSPADQQKQIATVVGMVKSFSRFAWLFTPIAILIGTLVQAAIMLLANSIGRGDGSFRKFFALSMNCAVVGTGLYYLVLGIVTRVRGADTFTDQISVFAAVPSLHLLAPGSHGFLGGFLAGFNVLYIWAAVLLGLGMIRMARIRPGVAWTTAVVLLLLAASFVGLGTLQS